jgi:hypothetical protein
MLDLSDTAAARTSFKAMKDIAQAMERSAR